MKNQTRKNIYLTSSFIAIGLLFFSFFVPQLLRLLVEDIRQMNLRRHEKSSQYRHAIVCVGYIHSERVFIIRNSHGTQWGDQGYGYLPYEYVTDKVLTKDLWAIKSIKNMNLIPVEEHRPWNDSGRLARSFSQQDMTDDRSNCELVYSSDDDEEQEESGQPRYSASSAQELDDEDESIQTTYPPPPIVFANPYHYHPLMFNPSPFFRPF